MRSPSGKKSLLARFAAPVALSIALHGLFVVGLWQLPVNLTASFANADPTLAPDENQCALRLDDAPKLIKRPTTTQEPRARDPVVQAAFDVHLAEPSAVPAFLPKSLTGAPRLPGSGVDAPNAPSGGLNDAPGNGGNLCALEVGASARTVVYVVDRSMSMGPSGALARARREVLASLRRLTPSTRFQVIAYNRVAEPLRINEQSGLLPADDNTLKQAAAAVSALRAGGVTDHGRALCRALVFHPDLIYFLTDADDVSFEDVKTATRLAAHHTSINTVELNGGQDMRAESPLRMLATQNGGAYRRLNPEER